jgi:hypothetical protein
MSPMCTKYAPKVTSICSFIIRDISLNCVGDILFKDKNCELARLPQHSQLIIGVYRRKKWTISIVLMSRRASSFSNCRFVIVHSRISQDPFYLLSLLEKVQGTSIVSTTTSSSIRKRATLWMLPITNLATSLNVYFVSERVIY